MALDRNRKIRIIIADDEKYICNMIRRLIRFDELGLELIATVGDGETLEKMIIEEQPDIVITDIRMPRQDGLEVIRNIREMGYETRFIVLSGYHQFEYAYNALKYKVNDYLLKPLNEDELNETLRKLVDELTKSSEQNRAELRVDRLHEIFMDMVHHNEYASASLDELNDKYMLNLHEGAFRYVYLVLDDSRINKNEDEDISSVSDKLRNLSSSKLASFCYQYLDHKINWFIKILMNYDEKDSNVIDRELHSLFSEATALVDLFSGLRVTMCVGNAVHSADELYYAELITKELVFSRIVNGTGRILTHDMLPEADLSPQISAWNDRIRRAYETLDKDAFAAAVDEIFRMPSKIMASKQFAEYVLQINEIMPDLRKKLQRTISIDKRYFQRNR